MNQSRLCDCLDDILEAARQACSYVEGMNKEHFLADTRTQQAVTMNLVIIGEAATKLLRKIMATFSNDTQACLGAT